MNPMYEKVKKLYIEGRIDESGLDKAVKYGWITEEQKKEIMALRPVD